MPVDALQDLFIRIQPLNWRLQRPLDKQRRFLYILYEQNRQIYQV